MKYAQIYTNNIDEPYIKSIIGGFAKASMQDNEEFVFDSKGDYLLYKAYINHWGPITPYNIELIYRNDESVFSEESLEIQRKTSLYEIDVNTGEILE